MEYLVTYGWAILAIVIIAAVLWYFGIFNPSKWTESRQCGGMSGFTCVDYSASTYSNGTPYMITLSLGNKVGRTVTVDCNNTQISLTVQTPLSCEVNESAISSAGSNQYNFNLVYTDSSSGLTHTDTGFVTIG